MATNEEQTAVDPVSESLAKTSARDSAPVIARTEASLRPALPRRTPTGTPSIPVSGAPLADMTARLEPLAQPGGTFRHTARELLALAAIRASDAAAAKKWTDMIVGDAETSHNIRGRIEVFTTLTEGAKS